MLKSELFKKISQINVWKKKEQRAPHKPLLLLLALSKCFHGKDRLIDYAIIDKELKTLLIEFGPQRQTYQPELPFYHLQNDDLWKIVGGKALPRRTGSKNIPRSILLKNKAKGGFPKDIFNYLRRKKNLIPEIAQTILESHFQETYHQDILDAVGLDRHYMMVKKTSRDPHFRERVLLAYEHRCAICGFNLRLDKANLGLEAAHIKWHQAGGPDIEPNGLALCALHHKVFDRGAVTISNDYQIMVSQHVYGSSGLEEWLIRFHNKAMLFPQSPKFKPNPEYLKWHHTEVFRSPKRYCGIKTFQEPANGKQ